MLNEYQQIAFELVKNGKSVFITGSPGTGKSYLIKEIIQYLKSTEKTYAITSSTGCSAALIGGQTIHSFLGMGINRSIENIITNLKKYKTKYDKIQNNEVLIIDEISMIDDHTLNNISEILKMIKNNKEEFGNTQIVFVGDFCQLSPVSGDFCFKSISWKTLNPICINLVELVRQKDDTVFQKILQEIRFGKCSKNTKKLLENMKNTVFEQNIKPTRLFSLNSDVDIINNNEYEKMYQKLHNKKVFDANIIECFPYSLTEENLLHLLTDYLHNDEVDIFRYNPFTNDKNKTNLKDYSIDLYKGLQVMVTRNINVERGLTNGTTGIIVNLNTECVFVKDLSSNFIHSVYYYTDKNENNGIYYKFMPIKLAYALSIHKSQGATLNAIEVDGSSSIFAPGQIYTALSRARKMSSIKLINFDNISIITNASVKQFYEDIKK